MYRNTNVATKSPGAILDNTEGVGPKVVVLDRA